MPLRTRQNINRTLIGKRNINKLSVAYAAHARIKERMNKMEVRVLKEELTNREKLLSNERYQIDEHGLLRVKSKRSSIIFNKMMKEEGYERD